eukprot:NODE_347_length_9026_cov_0.640641.p2 type:complete len:686 gc:universal NODE_347_length_9026_cov_0.640641:3945-1888(-)
MTLFNKILIANRGEIACRVIRTCKSLGIPTVAVYSDADKHSKHVEMANECYHIGNSPSSESYLRVDKLLKACQDLGVDAVHPGYGFLSEKPKFVKELEKNNISFIGPNSSAMTKMGDKIESKQIAKAAGVFTIPGFEGQIDTLDQAIAVANSIKYPIMLKASAGGGGKGMRICWNDKDVKEYYKLTKSEALNSFGDDRLLVEKFIENPRHIEIQLIGDKHGNTFYLPERECSIQRRNQKVVEEAPSTHLNEETRRKMGEQAVMLAKNVGYHSAGTVEFLVDPHLNFYFLEMNTRLQVEHPITELITGLDLVELMIKVAANEKLPLKQDEIKINGHAIEARVYAEDPVKYLPSIGSLTRYKEPSMEIIEETEGIIRNDSGIREGSDISIYYDPMICKLCTWHPSREGATELMGKALDSYLIKGVNHNIPLLRGIIDHEAWRSGDTSTKFLPTHYPNGFKPSPLSEEGLKFYLASSAAVSALRDLRNKTWIKNEQFVPSGHEQAWKFYISAPENVVTNEKYIKVKVNVEDYVELDDGTFNFEIQYLGGKHSISIEWNIEQDIINIVVDEKHKILQYSEPEALGFTMQMNGMKYQTKVLSQKQFEYLQYMKEKPPRDFSKLIVAPMPGSVNTVSVKVGDVVSEGSEILILEAMKMQNVLKSQSAGKIKKVNVKPGQTVAADEELVELE